MRHCQKCGAGGERSWIWCLWVGLVPPKSKLTRETIKLFTLLEFRRGDHQLCEHGSDQHETSAKCVSDDSQLSIFSRRNSFFGFFCGFSLFSIDFGGARDFLTSKSDSSRYFASDGQIFRSVGHLQETTTPSGLPTAERAGHSYARFLIFLE